MIESQSTFEFIDEEGEATEAFRFRNPDGSLGGWVAVSALVEPGALVEFGGLVAPGAFVESAQIVRRGELVDQVGGKGGVNSGTS